MNELENRVYKQYIATNDKARNAGLGWVKKVVAILTPSLVLLIGLQEKNETFSTTLLIVLIVTIILLTATIMIGLLVLKTEAIGWKKKRDKTAATWHEEGKLHTGSVILPNIISKYAETAFSVLSFLSIFSLAVFGVLKFIL